MEAAMSYATNPGNLRLELADFAGAADNGEVTA